MNYSSLGVLNLSVAVVICIGILLPSCSPQMPSTQPLSTRVDETGAPIAQTLGKMEGAQEAQRLDNHLAEPMKMKKEVEDVARRFKSEYASNPAVIAQASSRYRSCSQTLLALRDSVKRDLTAGGGTSSSTRSALKDYEKAGNDFRFYYDEVSNSGRFGSIIMIGIGLISQLFNLYSNYSQEKMAAISNGVDSRLTPVAWESL